MDRRTIAIATDNPVFLTVAEEVIVPAASGHLVIAIVAREEVDLVPTEEVIVALVPEAEVQAAAPAGDHLIASVAEGKQQARTRLAGASIPELDTCAERVLFATTLDQVFA